MNGYLEKRKSEFALNVKVLTGIERKKMQEKKCSKCGEIKFINEFYKSKGHKYGVSCWCRSCEVEYAKEYRKNYPERKKEACKKYILNNPEKRKESSKKYVENNTEERKKSIEKYYKNNLEKCKAAGKKWQKNNPLKVLDIRQKRRASLKGEMSEKIDLLTIYENHNWICGICGKKINKNLKHPHLKSVSLDHIIPLSKGGHHISNNVQPAHLFCNISKFNRISNIQLKVL